ncbi:TenA family transcriptional regulator [Alteromonas sp. a30]|uniref:TenA family transcriptional regulator n=1 Tax=Alteromonas sp. a30 TaxID=2730917 RepID=UPI003FA3B43F|nr:iron-containing redox enzyme family protein [Alteromonas sp. a30]
MSLYSRLVNETQNEKAYLLSAPIIKRCFQGNINVNDYVAFLQQAFHHVKHTVPLLMAVGARIPFEKEWLRDAVAEYIDEEKGHQEWVLNDIAACGFDKEQARHSQPAIATELMVSYAYDSVHRINPLCFFGMVFVLEGTSIEMADAAASSINDNTRVPAKAFSYLRSHGALDQEHIVFFENLMNQITDEKEQDLIIHSAKVFFRLYGNIFHELTAEHGLASAA